MTRHGFRSLRGQEPDLTAQATEPSIQNPKAQALIERAAEQYREGNLKQARKSLHAARQVDPYHVSTYEYEANIALDMGDQQGYLAALESVLSANPRSARLQNSTGKILVENGRPEIGLRALRRAVELAPRDSYYIQDLTAAYLRHRDAAAAAELM